MEQETNKKKLLLIGMSCLLILILVIGGTYAWFTLQLNGTKVNVLKAGTLSLILKDENSIGINQEKAVPMLDEEGEKLDSYHFTLENNSELPSDYTIYLDDIDLETSEVRMQDKFIKYNLVKNESTKTALLNTIGTHPNRVLDSGTISGNTTISYDLRLWLDEDADNEAMGTIFKGKLRVIATQEMKKNENIVAVYTYDTATCQTGEEATCVEIGKQATYNPGTIVKYKVNDTETKYFHVLFDNVDTLTMQQRENTIDTPIAWYQEEQTASQTASNDKIRATLLNNTMFLAGSYLGDNTKGPVTVLNALETATSGWTNVIEQKYTMGTTNFKMNPFTGCNYDSTGVTCTTNTYTLPERTSKVRMITAQEALSLGCSNVANSCPTWMNQYLNNDLNNPQKSTEYWTMSAVTSTSGGAISVGSDGSIKISITASQPYDGGNVRAGARAVVVIDK